MKVPMLQTEHDTWWHRRDPRVKWLIFLLMILMIYLSPTWIWMAGMVGLGMLLAILAKAPPRFLGLLLLIQLPNMLGLLVFPLLWGTLSFNAEFFLGLRLALGWIAGIFIGVSLISTMSIPEMVSGLRGLGLPRRAAFTVGYAFILVYLSFHDISETIHAMRLKGVDFSPRYPVRLIHGVVRIFVPALISIARRGGAMIGALEMRGVLESGKTANAARLKFDLGDAVAVVPAIALVAYAAAVDWQLVAALHPALAA